MATFLPFKAIRPLKRHAAAIASRPYDVLNSEEARLEAGRNKWSFYRVIKPEIEFPESHNHYSREVYLKGKENMEAMMKEGIFFREKKECFYVYRQIMPPLPGLYGIPAGEEHRQTGIVGCASVEDYFNGVIKKHELTRPEKEEDRKNHIHISGMNYEPVFLAYPAEEKIDNIVNEITGGEPEYNFKTEDGISHILWVVKSDSLIKKISGLFEKISSTYVADGHHRTAASARVGKEKRDSNPDHDGTEKYNFFMAVLFPDSQLRIIDYNRLVKDLNGLSPSAFIEKISESFIVEEKKERYRPARIHNFGMYIGKKWYSLTARPGKYNDEDPIAVLDVTILSEHILSGLLNIKDLRTDNRIDFVGGIRGLEELEKRVDSGEMSVAFALYPVSMKQLTDIADSGNIMPPKTTWFEPKLCSGLFVNQIYP